MNIGWIGLGKLGLPCALALEQHGGHQVIGYDASSEVINDILAGQLTPRVEARLPELVANTKMTIGESIADVVRGADELVFVSVPTPHAAEYGGERPMPEVLSDFNYAALREVTCEISQAAEAQAKMITMVVISTTLPGTMEREIVPLLGEHVTLAYNPFFIAMGTTVHDYLNPEFVLIGVEAADTDVTTLIDVYSTLVPAAPIVVLSLTEAELTKVAYNTFISMKIVFANTLMEICHKMNADVDLVSKALSFAKTRVISSAYLRGGMGDGGACHPRDNIAMSWLAEQLELSADPFEFVTHAREVQSAWLTDEVVALSYDYELPIVILGKSYKPGSDLTYGSPALLLRNQLAEFGVEVAAHWDPYVDQDDAPLSEPAVFVLATRHDEFADLDYPVGSVVFDPFRYVKPQDHIVVVPVGGGGKRE